MGTHQREADRAFSDRYFDPGDRWVPVDRRWLGMDKRTIAPALIVLALAFLQGVLLPRIDAAVPEKDVTVAGDVIALQGGVEFTAAAGWSLVAGERRSDEPTGEGYPREAVLTRGGTQFVVRVGTYDGDAPALLAQIERTDELLGGALRAGGDPVAISTRSGVDGVITRYAAATADGVLAAFVLDGKGIEVVAVGPAEPGQDILGEVAEMIAGIGRMGDAR
ncbi:hypothetical protein ACIA5E_03100 [Nocardia asteroides]|uniref:hypothetical protein n=1 Tax=Nocardia asteroides TaxID=1824 RepID=UPI0037A293FD